MSRTPSTEVAERDENTELVPAELAAEIAAAQAAEYGDEPLQTPILKIGQGLTREVQDGNAEVGEFINTLTGDGLGDTVEFVVAYYNQGRFATGPKGSKVDGRAFVAFGSTIPESWEELVGPEFVGTPFSEYPEAEETFKAQVNAKQREWGSGPLVSTTHNYTGLVIVEGEEEGDYSLEPVRLSLKRIDIPAHKKLQSLLRAVLRGKPTWDRVVRLSTTRKEFGRNAAYTINPTDVRFIRATTADERQLASEVALAVMHGRTVSDGAEDALEDRPSEPKGEHGGLAV